MIQTRITFLLVMLFCLSCGADDNKASPRQEKPERYGELMAKRALYFDLAQQLQDNRHGWFTDDCDSLLWNSLGVAAGLKLDIYAARDTDGQWFRTPGQRCYEEGRSASTISKDMLLGLAWALFYNGDSGDFLNVLRYGRDRAFVMGEGPLSRTLMTPSLQAVYAEAAVAMGGQKFEPEFHYPQIYNAGNRGYQAHLQVLNILFRAKTVGGVSDEGLERLNDHAARNPTNALFVFGHDLYSGGDLSRAVNLLLDSPAFPAGRLPSSEDRCRGWLWEREMSNPSTEPCPEQDKQYHGVDLLFVAKLIAEVYGER